MPAGITFKETMTGGFALGATEPADGAARGQRAGTRLAPSPRQRRHERRIRHQTQQVRAQLCCGDSGAMVESQAGHPVLDEFVKTLQLRDHHRAPCRDGLERRETKGFVARLG